MNKKGLSLVELVVYLGLSSLVLVVGAVLIQNGTELTKNSERFSSLGVIRTQIKEAMSRRVNIKATIDSLANASAFECYNTKSDCTGQVRQIILFQKGVDETLPPLKLSHIATPGSNEGFDLKGAVCNTFDATNGNNACPYRYIAKWEAKCPDTGDCRNPIAIFTANLEFKPQNLEKFPPLNPKAYKVSVVSREMLASDEFACTSVKGAKFDPITKTCALQLGDICRPHEFIVGFKPDGGPICQGVKGFLCPHGEVLLGIDGDGIAYCGPGCGLTTSTSGSIWE